VAAIINDRPKLELAKRPHRNSVGGNERPDVSCHDERRHHFSGLFSIAQCLRTASAALRDGAIGQERGFA
jgi:hypothetical protein